ncbi:hypothetical protein V8E53_000910 [Lactarius tabidus]
MAFPLLILQQRCCGSRCSGTPLSSMLVQSVVNFLPKGILGLSAYWETQVRNSSNRLWGREPRSLLVDYRNFDSEPYKLKFSSRRCDTFPDIRFSCTKMYCYSHNFFSGHTPGRRMPIVQALLMDNRPPRTIHLNSVWQFDDPPSVKPMSRNCPRILSSFQRRRESRYFCCRSAGAGKGRVSVLSGRYGFQSVAF